MTATLAQTIACQIEADARHDYEVDGLRRHSCGRWLHRTSEATAQSAGRRPRCEVKGRSTHPGQHDPDALEPEPLSQRQGVQFASQREVEGCNLELGQARQGKEPFSCRQSRG